MLDLAGRGSGVPGWMLVGATWVYTGGCHMGIHWWVHPVLSYPWPGPGLTLSWPCPGPALTRQCPTRQCPTRQVQTRQVQIRQSLGKFRVMELCALGNC